MARSIAVLGIMAVASASCLSTMQVRRLGTPSSEAVHRGFPGLPFYVKRATCQLSETLVERITVARLVIRRDGETVFDDTRLLPRPSPGLDELKEGIVDLNRDLDAAPSTWPTSASAAARSFQAIPEAMVVRPDRNADGTPVHADRYQVAATQVAAHSFVDYATQFTMNTKRPWIGSSTVEATLASDGTLAGAKAVAEDAFGPTLATAAAGLAPVGVALIQRAAADAAADAASAATEKMMDWTANRTPPPRKLEAALILIPRDVHHVFAYMAPHTDAFPCRIESVKRPADESHWEYTQTVQDTPRRKAEEQPADPPETGKDPGKGSQ